MTEYVRIHIPKLLENLLQIARMNLLKTPSSSKTNKDYAKRFSRRLSPGFVPPGGLNYQQAAPTGRIFYTIFKTVHTIVCYSEFLLQLTELTSTPALVD
jgi:hypothetical protein